MFSSPFWFSLSFVTGQQWNTAAVSSCFSYISKQPTHVKSVTLRVNIRNFYKLIIIQKVP